MNFYKPIYTSLSLLIAACGFVSCGSDDDSGPSAATDRIAGNIVGQWLLASSDADAWATYEFTETTRINATVFENSTIASGTGFYWINEDKSSLTANYRLDDGNTIYLDWIVASVQPFEIAIDIYGNNQQVGRSSIYRIVSEKTLAVDTPAAIDFKSICGTDRVSALRVLDSSVAVVSDGGTVKGVKAGETFLTFATDKGHAALRIVVVPAAKPFAELVVGTWIYDKLTDSEWQRTTFVADGYVDVAWTNPESYTTIETASGHYTLSGTDCSFVVTTPYNVKYNQKWVTEEINDLIWTYRDYFDGNYVGKYTGQKLLGSVTLARGESYLPDYPALVPGYVISGYSSKNTSVARVDASTGKIQATGSGRTYVDVATAIGAGVYEVNVE